MSSVSNWWRRLRSGLGEPPQHRSHAVIVSLDEELTFPSPALATYLADLERRLVEVVNNTGDSQYEGREEVSAGSRLLFFTADPLRLCREMSPAIYSSPIAYALSVRWSNEPMSAIWHEWTLPIE